MCYDLVCSDVAQFHLANLTARRALRIRVTRVAFPVPVFPVPDSRFHLKPGVCRGQKQGGREVETHPTHTPLVSSGIWNRNRKNQNRKNHPSNSNSERAVRFARWNCATSPRTRSYPLPYPHPCPRHFRPISSAPCPALSPVCPFLSCHGVCPSQLDAISS